MRTVGGFAAAMIAGGRSSRMGTDKAFIKVEGVPLWQRQLELLRGLSPAQIILSANAVQEFPGLGEGVELVRDPVDAAGPLAGLTAVLGASREERVLVIAVDMPNLSREFLEQLLGAGEPLVYRDATGRFEPLPAVYPSSAADLARGSLLAGRLALQAFLGDLVGDGRMRTRLVTDGLRGQFQSWNRPSDLVEASRVVR